MELARIVEADYVTVPVDDASLDAARQISKREAARGNVAAAETQCVKPPKIRIRESRPGFRPHPFSKAKGYDGNVFSSGGCRACEAATRPLRVSVIQR